MRNGGVSVHWRISFTFDKLCLYQGGIVISKIEYWQNVFPIAEGGNEDSLCGHVVELFFALMRC